MSSKILVTGAAGFLGSHLVDTLLEEGHMVAGLDDLSTGNLANLSGALANDNFRFIQGNVESTSLLKSIHADFIYHLACPASPAKYQPDPIKTLNTCYLGAVAVLESAKASKSTVLLASTSEVYGDPLQHPQDEQYRGNVKTTGLRGCYDNGKRVAETLFDAYHRQHGVSTRIARIFNTFGPRMSMDDGRLLTNLIVARLNGEPMPIYGDGKQTRTLNYYTYTITGLIKLMKSSAINQPINIGGEIEVSVNEIAEMVAKCVGDQPLTTIHHPLPENDPQQRKPALALAKFFIDYKPDLSPQKNLPAMIKDLEMQLILQKNLHDNPQE